jgi:hypothetical protein
MCETGLQKRGASAGFGFFFYICNQSGPTRCVHEAKVS